MASRIATVSTETQGAKRRFVEQEDEGESTMCKPIKRPRLRAIEKVIEESCSDTATKLEYPYRMRLNKKRVMLDNEASGCCVRRMGHWPLESTRRGKRRGPPGSSLGFRKESREGESGASGERAIAFCMLEEAKFAEHADFAASLIHTTLIRP